jgi:hypothetical protein
VLSALGLVVFPWSAGFDDGLKELDYEQLVGQGWPTWTVSLGDVDTLGQLVRHVRNAIAHRRISFSSDDLDSTSVEIEFHDAPGEKAPANWRATIRADHLREFCLKFASLVEQKLG